MQAQNETADRFSQTLEIESIYELLLRLGVSSKFRGYRFVSYSVWLAANDPQRLQYVTKWVYPDVAKHYNTNWSCVERGIRIIRDMVWNDSRPHLETAVGRQLEKRPTTSEFLRLLTGVFVEDMSEAVR